MTEHVTHAGSVGACFMRGLTGLLALTQGVGAVAGVSSPSRGGVLASDILDSAHPKAHAHHRHDVNATAMPARPFAKQRLTHAPPRPFEVVVAHYDEDLRWLGGHQHEATVYCKGPPERTYRGAEQWIYLPNIGVEANSYLHHIVHRYHHLADLTFFSQGRIEDTIDDYRGFTHHAQRALESSQNITTFRGLYVFEDWENIPFGGKWGDELESGIIKAAAMNRAEF